MTTSTVTAAFEVLLVEDNPGDVDLARECLGGGDRPVRLSAVENGVEALAFLRRQGNYTGAPRPDLILLDLNLPLKDGRETLREIKADGDLRDIPVVILTTSAKDEDVQTSYRLHANCHVVKPLRLDDLRRVMRSLEEFWFAAVTLPPRK